MARSTIVSHETAVGAFLLLAAALFGAFLVVKGSRVGFGSREIAFVASAGQALKVGAAVKMRGIEVGEVSRVQLTKENKVEIHLKIYSDFADNVRADAVAFLDEPPLLGSTTVELSPGDKSDRVASGQTVSFGTKEGLMTKVQTGAEDMKKVVDKVTSITEKLDSTLATISVIVSRVNRGDGVAGRLLNDEKLATDFVSGVNGLVAVVDDVKAGRGAFALLKDEDLAPNLRATVADVRSLTDAIARGDGALGRLATNATLVTEGEGVLKDVRGALARLDEITTSTTKTTAKVQDVLDSAKGSLDKLKGSIENVEKVTSELAGITEKVNKGQGTLAKLVNDDALFRETKALLKELRESVEDLREQAPINSFIGVVFSAF